MKLEDQVKERSGNQCETCGSSQDLQFYEVGPQDRQTIDNTVHLCQVCIDQIERKVPLDEAHWDCLNISMWSEVPGIQVLSWRLLSRLKAHSWAADKLDLMYLEEDRLAWAKATGDHDNDDVVALHKDANGQVLQNGDTVVLTKSLDVKGSTLNAKLGTVVKNIRLVPDNVEQIEGKIEGQTIVILTKYLRKQG
jgi:protein PhnA